MIELRPNAARQYIDAVATFEAWEEALADADQVRGGMYWHKGPPNAPEQQYLMPSTPSDSAKTRMTFGSYGHTRRTCFKTLNPSPQ
jgi:hypothetical protein